MTRQLQPLSIAFGTTALEAGIAGAGIDGIGHYTSALREHLEKSANIRLREYVFCAAGDVAAAGAYPVGKFQLQAAVSLLTNCSFRGFQTLLREEEVDLVHATDHFVPRLKNKPVVATLMDAIPLSNPEWVDFSRVKGMAWRRSMRWANRIITISEYSRQSIAEYFGIPISNIDVIPLGVDADWFSPTSHEEIADVAKRHSLPTTYFLFVGTLQPRKNLDRLIKAHQALPLSIRQAYPLVVVGRNGWGVDDLAARLEANVIQHVRWLRYLPAADLHAIVTSAHALVLPSLAEGFGLPVLEAFASKTAVIASDTTSIPEVAGDAALLVDPMSIDSIRDALEAIAEDAISTSTLVEKGLERARTFTWERTAELTLASYRKLL